MSIQKPDYVGLIEKNYHVALFYEDESQADNIRVEFIKKGLEKDEQCVYITSTDDVSDFKKSLSESGIDIDELEAQNRFIAYVVSDPVSGPNRFEGTVVKAVTNFSKLSNGTSRFAFKVIGSISRYDDEALEAYVAAEKFIDENFKHGNYILCTLKIDEANPEARQKMMKAAFSTHNVAMFSPNGKTESLFYLNK